MVRCLDAICSLVSFTGSVLKLVKLREAPTTGCAGGKTIALSFPTVALTLATASLTDAAPGVVGSVGSEGLRDSAFENGLVGVVSGGVWGEELSCLFSLG